MSGVGVLELLEKRVKKLERLTRRQGYRECRHCSVYVKPVHLFRDYSHQGLYCPLCDKKI